MNADSVMRSRVAVLFVHGIVGNSRFFDFLQPSLPQGVVSECITLTGHGGDALDFSKASMGQWRRQVTEIAARLRADYDRVVIVAHSMGTLFAINEAVEGRADALFLLNTPLRIRLTRRLFTNPVRVMLGLTGNPLAAAARDAYGVAIDYNPLHYYGWPARYIELFAEIRRVRKIVHRLACPTRVFLSGKDEMVSPSSASFFESPDCCELTVLPKSGHYYYTPGDRRYIVDEFEKFLSQFI